METSKCSFQIICYTSFFTLLHICEGANITLKEFFDSPIFDEVEAIERERKKYKGEVHTQCGRQLGGIKSEQM